MSTPPVWLQYLTVIVSFSAFCVSALTLVLQRRDKRPHLRATVEIWQPAIKREADRTDTWPTVHSYYVVNTGSITVGLLEVRLLSKTSFQIPNETVVEEAVSFGIRLKQFKQSVLTKNQSVRLPLIEADKPELHSLQEKLQKMANVKLPYKIDPGERVRLTAWESTLERLLLQEGYRNLVRYQVGIRDSLGKLHTTWGTVQLPERERELKP